jgi:hypothetical protein
VISAVSVPADALNVPFVAPAATVTDAGTVSCALLVLRFTVVPPDGAAADKVTVQVVFALDRRYVAVQFTADTTVAGSTVSVAAFVDAPADAVIVTVVGDVPESAPTAALKVPDEDPAGIVTEADTVTMVELLVKATGTAADAGAVRATVHGTEEFDAAVEGLQLTDNSDAGAGITVNTLLTEDPFHAAVIPTVVDAVTAVVVAVNVPVVFPAATVTVAGVVTAA